MQEVHKEPDMLSLIAEWASPSLDRHGTHLTGLLRISRGLAVSGNIYDEPVQPNGRMNMGKIWERCALDWLRAAVWADGVSIRAPYQTEMDGVAVTLDGLSYKGTQRRRNGTLRPVHPIFVVECKLRFARPHQPQDRPDWIEQVKGYCYSVGVKAAWMPVLFLPRMPDQPSAQLFKLSFTTQELKENWQMVMSAKRYIESRGGASEEDRPIAD